MSFVYPILSEEDYNQNNQFIGEHEDFIIQGDGKIIKTARKLQKKC